MIKLPPETRDYLFDQVLHGTHCLIVSLNSDSQITDLVCPLGDWAVEGIDVGACLPETLSALLTVTPAEQAVTLYPFVNINDVLIADVHILIDGTERTVLLRDVSEVHTAELKFQQKAHEVSLLLEKQTGLNRALERQQAEIERISQAKSQFIASMSHEFRSPITSIMGHAEILTRQMGETDLPQAIHRASWHLLTLVENLLEQARQGESAVQIYSAPVELSLVLNDMRDMFKEKARNRGLKLVVKAPPPGIQLETDELRLRQVLINLISNALRFTDKGEVRLTVAQIGDNLEFSVKDTGPGISESDQELIFQPFRRLDNNRTAGAGLGLSITRQLLEAMGGNLRVHSEPGQGSTFIFTLRYCAQGSSLPGTDLHGYEVLLVDDDADVLAIYKLFFEDWGLKVITAFDLSTALELLEQQSFDLVFTDLHLQQENGIDLLKAVHRQQPACKKILCSGSGFSPGWQRQYGEWTDEFLMKPIRTDNLRAALNRTMGPARGLSSKAQTQQALLQVKYIDSLPGKRDRIDRCLQKFLSGDGNKDGLNDLKTEVHRLAGSAENYGFEDLGSLAMKLEDTLKSGTSTTEQLDKISRQISDLLQMLETAAKS